MNWILTAIGANPMVLVWGFLITVAVSGGAGTAAGWTANGWRLGTEVSKLETQLATCNGSLTRERDSNGALLGSLNVQTKAIQQLAADGKARDARAAAAEAKAKVEADGLDAKAAGILGRALPKSPADDCAKFAIELNEEIRGRRGP